MSSAAENAANDKEHRHVKQATPVAARAFGGEHWRGSGFRRRHRASKCQQKSETQQCRRRTEPPCTAADNDDADADGEHVSPALPLLPMSSRSHEPECVDLRTVFARGANRFVSVDQGPPVMPERSGVIPYYVDPVGGDVFWLLGRKWLTSSSSSSSRRRRRRLVWCDFGGGFKTSRGEGAVSGMLREVSEEFGLMMAVEVGSVVLANRQDPVAPHVAVWSVVNGDGDGEKQRRLSYLFLVRIAPPSLPTKRNSDVSPRFVPNSEVVDAKYVCDEDVLADDRTLSEFDYGLRPFIRHFIALRRGVIVPDRPKAAAA